MMVLSTIAVVGLSYRLSNVSELDVTSHYLTWSNDWSHNKGNIL